MVTNLKQTKGELEKSQHQLQSIISNVMDGIITINEVGEIQGFSPAAELIFGYSYQEVIGKNLIDFIGKYWRNGKENESSSGEQNVLTLCSKKRPDIESGRRCLHGERILSGA